MQCFGTVQLGQEPTKSSASCLRARSANAACPTPWPGPRRVTRIAGAEDDATNSGTGRGGFREQRTVSTATSCTNRRAGASDQGKLDHIGAPDEGAALEEIWVFGDDSVVQPNLGVSKRRSHSRKGRPQ